jgi:hydrogenase maturation protease
MTAVPSSIVIIGVGNEYRSDDGAGVAVVRRLRALLPAGITILEQSGEGAALIQAWQGAAWVMLVDAARSGAPSGTIHRLNARAEPMPTGFFNYSTHAFSVAEAVELARSLDQLPPHLVVYGIEGENFAAGVGLSAAVERAVEVVVERAAAEIRTAASLKTNG